LKEHKVILSEYRNFFINLKNLEKKYNSHDAQYLKERIKEVSNLFNFLKIHQEYLLNYTEDNKFIFDILLNSNYFEFSFFIYSLAINNSFDSLFLNNLLVNNIFCIKEDNTVITYLDIFEYGETIQRIKYKENLEKEQQEKEKSYKIISLCASLNLLAISIYFIYKINLNIPYQKEEENYLKFFFISSIFSFCVIVPLVEKITSFQQDLKNTVKKIIKKTNKTEEEYEKDLNKEIISKSICKYSILAINSIIYCFAKYIEKYFRQDDYKNKDTYYLRHLVTFNILLNICILEINKKYTKIEIDDKNKKNYYINKLLLTRELATMTRDL
jgi:hypothetical protein